jgi:hypothetical protein
LGEPSDITVGTGQNDDVAVVGPHRADDAQSALAVG